MCVIALRVIRSLSLDTKPETASSESVVALLAIPYNVVKTANQITFEHKGFTRIVNKGEFGGEKLFSSI